MIAPEIRRARKGETRCEQCKHAVPREGRYAGKGYWCFVGCPWIGESTRRDNTCEYAEKREGEA